MNKFPLLEMLVVFIRHSRVATPTWRKEFVRHTKRVRSRHTREIGGIKKSFYSIETKEGEILNLELDQEELIWYLEQSGEWKGFTVDRVLAHFKRHKHAPSDAHRIEPIRFEIFPKELIERTTPIELADVDRVKPYRFQRGKNGSTQVRQIETKHMEPRIPHKNFHYVIEDTDGRFFHVVFIPDLCDWRFIKEVDEQFFFVRKNS